MCAERVRTRRAGSLLAGVFAAAVTMLIAGAAFADREPAMAGNEPIIRRLSERQYTQIIADVFGRTIKIRGRFEPDVRDGGLLAVGSGRVSVTESGLEQFDAIARNAAAQIVDEQHRNTLIPCKPVSIAASDNACASQFLSAAGRLLYRRPMAPVEIQEQVAVADAASKSLGSFYSGVATSLATMLEAPEFLFRQETAEADPSHAGQYRLNAFSKATLLSFFFWNTAPDRQLLAAAESGALNTEKGLASQVDRLLASPRLEDGIRAFFIDMLQFDEFDSLTKDSAIYPKFTVEVSHDAREQTLRTIIDQILTRRGDYRDIFTTRKTFLTPVLGAIYNVPVAEDEKSANGAPEPWVPYEYADGDPRGVGILTQASFVALHSHPGRSSPTLRGKALREILLCQKVPPPPGNVNFTVVQDTSNAKFRTARERLTAHRTDPTCAGCHKLIDPMGLAMENFDSAGGYRATENDAAIDSSGELDGVKFTDATGLGIAMHDNPAASSCLVSRLYAYATGRSPNKGETEFVRYLEKSFASNSYRLPDLMRSIATSDALYRVAAPQTGALDISRTPTATAIESSRETGK